MISPKQKLEMYGVKEKIEILGAISLACSIFGNGSRGNANLVLEKTAAVESQLGTYPDYRPEHGESVFQFDEPTFDWIKEKLLYDSDYVDEVLLFRKHYNIDVGDIEYSDLRNNINLATALARIRYKFIPTAFPVEDYEQYLYYKKWWNSSEGDGDYQHWQRSVGDCYFA